MKVDGGVSNELANAAASAKQTEAAGYDGAWSVETAHDPFLPLLLAAEHTEHLELGTSIAVAFARNPMTLAHLAGTCSRSRRVGSSSDWAADQATITGGAEWSHPATHAR